MRSDADNDDEVLSSVSGDAVLPSEEACCEIMHPPAHLCRLATDV